jgi:hypothetical protein
VRKLKRYGIVFAGWNGWVVHFNAFNLKDLKEKVKEEYPTEWICYIFKNV